MSKKKQIQDYESKRLIDELSKMPPMVIATAYLHAINYTLYGEDVTKKWVTATQNAAVLEKAYRKGYYDALQRQVENATNGDMIKTMFPNIDFAEMSCTVHATTSVTSNGVKGGISYDFWKEWWNAPYKAEREG
jgi:hypothetical protein